MHLLFFEVLSNGLLQDFECVRVELKFLPGHWSTVFALRIRCLSSAYEIVRNWLGTPSTTDLELTGASDSCLVSTLFVQSMYYIQTNTVLDSSETTLKTESSRSIATFVSPVPKTFLIVQTMNGHDGHYVAFFRVCTTTSVRGVPSVDGRLGYALVNLICSRSVIVVDGLPVLDGREAPLHAPGCRETGFELPELSLQTTPLKRRTRSERLSEKKCGLVPTTRLAPTATPRRRAQVEGGEHGEGRVISAEGEVPSCIVCGPRGT
ncbi:hypothetical protein BDZ89DRAFT_1040818 [Hymenopellis radicata]|nr:hypothetical protein BDZ89DRAFT_1040818 [Hymenopellis radicata]